MDMFAIAVKIVEAVPRLMPPPPPPKINYLSLIEHIPNSEALYESHMASARPPEVQAVRVVSEEVQPKLLSSDPKLREMPKDTQQKKGGPHDVTQDRRQKSPLRDIISLKWYGEV